MKNSKYLLLAAIAAATAMVSSCSDNGDLSTPTKEAEGKALIVNATLNESRVTPLTKSSFGGFKLFGIQNPVNNQSVGSFIKTGDASGVDYSGTFGETAADVAFTSTTAVKWPTKYPDNSANFYAISVQGGSDFTDSGISYSEAEIQAGTFKYTAPVDGDGNVDLSAQKDIMIASSIEAKKTDNGGVVTLPFKHAFAKLTFQIRWNANEWIDNASTAVEGTITPYARLFVKSIKFHNIKCSGTYSFTENNGNGKWTVNGDNSTITYEFETPQQFTATDVVATAANPFEVQDLLNGANTIMIVPQTIQTFGDVSENLDGGVFTNNSTGAYIELVLFSYGTAQDVDAHEEGLEQYYNTVDFATDQANSGTAKFVQGFGELTTSNEMVYESVYIPIKGATSSFEFKENKSYNFRLNLATCFDDYGSKRLGTVEFNNN